MTAPLLDDVTMDPELPVTLTPVHQGKGTLSDQLYPMSWFDRWNREWVGTAHMKHGHPVGPIRLHPRYQVPFSYLVPPHEFLAFGKRGSNTVDVRLKEWQEATAAAWGTYNRRLMEIARKLYKDKAADEVASGNPDLYNLAGAPPLHEKFLAAMDRNIPWVLGIVNPATGKLDPTPKWATPALLDTLRKRETFAGSAAVTRFTDDDFADEDAPTWAPEAEDTVARLDGAARYEALEDEFDDPPAPAKPIRGKGGQFQKTKP